MNTILRPDNIDVVILCGGLGTRLKGIVSDRPKPMVEIKGRPFLDILIGYISGFGFKHFILCAGYKGDFIERYYRTKGSGDLKISFVKEKEPLGTGGAIKNAESLIKSSVFLVMNGDSFCTVDINCFLEFHMTKKAEISISVAKTGGAVDYGIINLDDDNRIINFTEKIEMKEGVSVVNAGIYLFNKAVLGLIPAAQKYSLEYDLFPTILDRKIYGYITDKKLLDIGTPEKLKVTRKILEENDG